jgi:hypothetical protein
MPLEDTYVLEGLVQGPLPHGAGSVERLEQLARQSPHLSFQMDGGQFSLLADEKVHDSRKFQPRTITSVVCESLEQMMELLEPHDRAKVFSTLRSREYRPNTEHQTVYLVTPEGDISAQSRDTNAAVDRRPEPPTRKEKLMMVAAGAGVLALVLAVSTIFIDYKQLLGRAVTNIRGTGLADVKVDASALNGYLVVTATAIDSSKGKLELTLERGPRWEEGLKSQPTAGAWPDALAAAAIHRRYAVIIMRDIDGVVIRSTFMPLDDLHAHPQSKFILEFGGGQLLRSVVIRP